MLIDVKYNEADAYAHSSGRQIECTLHWIFLSRHLIFFIGSSIYSLRGYAFLWRNLFFGDYSCYCKQWNIHVKIAIWWLFLRKKNEICLQIQHFNARNSLTVRIKGDSRNKEKSFMEPSICTLHPFIRHWSRVRFPYPLRTPLRRVPWHEPRLYQTGWICLPGHILLKDPMKRPNPRRIW